MSSKSVLPECCAIVSSKGVLQECHLSVSTQGVSQVGSLENVRLFLIYVSAFGFVGFIFFSVLIDVVYSTFLICGEAGMNLNLLFATGVGTQIRKFALYVYVKLYRCSPGFGHVNKPRHWSGYGGYTMPTTA